MNKRKDKILLSIWLAESEKRILKESIESEMFYLIGSIMKKANSRGDFEIK